MIAESNGISVIICCYNSANRLPETLKHLALQDIPKNIQWEIIVVDNASTDNTKEIAESEWSHYFQADIKLSVIDEKEPGLSYARSTGIKHSQFEYIIFCDDDNWLNRDYLLLSYNLLLNNKNFGAVGGQGLPISNIDMPQWFNENEGAYAVGKQAISTSIVNARGYLWGSGLAVKKTIYKKAFENQKSFLIGRKGEQLSSGEDSEICLRIILMGYDLYYDSHLIYKHFIEPYKLTKAYLNGLLEGFGRASLINSKYSQLIEVKKMATKKKIIILLKSVLRVIRSYFLIEKRKYIHTSVTYISCILKKDVSKNDIILNKILKEWA